MYNEPRLSVQAEGVTMPCPHSFGSGGVVVDIKISSGQVDCIKLRLLMPSVSVKHDVNFDSIKILFFCMFLI